MSLISGINSSGLNFTGLSTGIDTSKIIDGLTSLTQNRIKAFRQRQASQTATQAVFTGLQNKLSALRGTIPALARSIGGAVEARKVTSSDETAITGTASTSAANGSYSIKVNSLAQAQQLASNTFSTPTAVLKTGTVDIKVGAGATSTITINSSNNTLQGLAQAINDANIEVKAAVVGDGTNYRLLLSSTKTGAANTISITNNLTSGSGATIDLTNQTVQDAADASITIGSGSGALTITNSSNRIDNVITGVTLNLNKADSTKTINLSVGADTTTAVNAVQDFVNAYNEMMDYIDARDNFDPQTQTAGPLLGNKDVAELKTALSMALSSAVAGVNGGMNRIQSVGLSFDDKGKLVFDSSKLSKAINGEIPGITATDVKRLFALSGTSDTNAVSFIVGGSKTKPSPSGQPYQVKITQAATRASVVGAATLGGSIVINTSNNTFRIRLNGISEAVIVIDPGTYTPASLVAAIQTQIIGRFGTNGATVDLEAGKLRFTSAQFGSSAKVETVDGNALATLGFAPGTTGVGVNVAGQFIVNGNVETASGSGQFLTGSAGNANTSGMQVRATYTPDQVGPSGVTSNMTVTEGTFARVSRVLDRYLDPVNGRMKVIDEGFRKGIEQLEKTVSKETASLELKKNNLLTQFAGLESSVQRLRALGNQIAASFGIANF